MQKRKEIIILLIVTVIATIFIIVGNQYFSYEATEQENMDFYSAKVVSVGEAILEPFSLDGGASTIENKQIPFTATFTTGPNKNESFEGSQSINGMFMIQPKQVKTGDRILVIQNVGANESDSEWIYVEHNRSNYLIFLCLFFLLLIILIGRTKGLTTILSLIFTAGAIFLVYIPSILKGFNIYLATIIICIYIILVSLTMISGINKKTLSTILGNIGGVAVAGLLAYFMNHLLNITGFIDEDYALLVYMQTSSPIDLRAVVWGSIVIGSLGAIMDVAMTIASAMNELADHMKKKSFFKMLKSGMNIGIDSIGTMTNTLVLAYIGGSLAMVLLLVAYNKNVLYLFNLEMIVVEVLQAIIGSIGILFAVPATAIFSAYIFNRKNRLEIDEDHSDLIKEK